MLVRLDGDTEISLGEGADRVGQAEDMIERLIGLTYDGFTRSVLLPQGKFAEFLTGGRGGAEPARALMTVMFTDIVDSTARAAVVGDGRWRDLLARHDEEVRKQLARFGGRDWPRAGCV